MGHITAAQANTLIAEFEADWFGTDDEPRRFSPVRGSSLVLDDAARLTGLHGLRAYDAVQLASARAVRRADPAVGTVATFDHTLRDAAAVEGFTIIG